MRLYVRISTSCSCRHTHCGTYIYIYTHYEWTTMFSISVRYFRPSAASSFSFTWSRNMKRERDSCTICEHTNIAVWTLSYFILHTISYTVLNSHAFCYYNVFTVNILLYYVISIISREVSVFVYASFASWEKNSTIFSFLPQKQTQLLALLLLLLLLLHLPYVFF